MKSEKQLEKEAKIEVEVNGMKSKLGKRERDYKAKVKGYGVGLKQIKRESKAKKAGKAQKFIVLDDTPPNLPNGQKD